MKPVEGTTSWKTFKAAIDSLIESRPPRSTAPIDELLRILETRGQLELVDILCAFYQAGYDFDTIKRFLIDMANIIESNMTLPELRELIVRLAKDNWFECLRRIGAGEVEVGRGGQR